MDEVYSSKRYKPTEEILQYGSVNSETIPDEDTFNQVINDYWTWKRDWSKNHGGNLILLDVIAHHDEDSPHAHLREVWGYTDEYGTFCIGKEKGLEQAGVPLPDPSKPEGRFNNRNMTYTKMCREKLHEIFRDYGFEVEDVPLPRRKHKSVDEYKADMERQFFAERESELNAKEEALKQQEQLTVGEIRRKAKEMQAEEDAVKEMSEQEKQRERRLREF